MKINYKIKIISCLFILILLFSFSTNGCIKPNKNINNQHIRDENKIEIIDLGKDLTKEYVSPFDNKEKGYFISQGTVLENDIMYISGNSENTKIHFEGVLALNIIDNKILWKTTIKDGVFHGYLIKYNDYLYVTSDKYLTCLNKNTGKQLFKKEIECSPNLIPAVNNNILYVGGRIPPKFTSLYALNPDTGEEMYSIETGGHFEYTPTFHDNMAFYNTLGGSIFAIRYAEDYATRYHFESLWGREGQNAQDSLVGSPVYWNGNIYSQYHPAAYWIVSDRYLICYDVLTGKEKWKLLLAHYSDVPLNNTSPYEYLVKLKYKNTEYDVYYQQPFLHKDQLYLVTDKGFLVIDPPKGRIKKVINIDHEFLYNTDFLDINENIAYWWYSTAEEHNMIYLFDLNREMIDMVIKTPIDYKLSIRSVLFKDNYIYVLSNGGIIFIVDRILRKNINTFRINGDLNIDKIE